MPYAFFFSRSLAFMACTARSFSSFCCMAQYILSPEFGFDEFSDVYHGHKKCVDSFLLLIPALGSRMPTLEDKQSSRPTHI